MESNFEFAFIFHGSGSVSLSHSSAVPSLLLLDPAGIDAAVASTPHGPLSPKKKRKRTWMELRVAAPGPTPGLPVSHLLGRLSVASEAASVTTVVPIKIRA